VALRLAPSGNYYYLTKAQSDFYKLIKDSEDTADIEIRKILENSAAELQERCQSTD
jgi:hypothetical protein